MAQGGWPVRRGLLAEQSRPHANDLWTLAGHVPSLDLRFAETKSLRDQVTGQNLVSFSRSSAGTFVDAGGIIRSAAANAPRFDHDPATGRCLGLLMEEARTNPFPYTTNMGAGYWSVGTFENDISVISNAETAPDGSRTAIFIKEGTVSNYKHYIRSSSGLNSLASTNYTYSVYAKANGRRYVSLFCDQPFKRTVYDLLGPTSFDNIDVGNGWRRLIHYFTSRSTNPEYNSFFIAMQADAVNDSNYVARNYTGNGVSGIYVWGAQMELGSFPTSYIPTPATFTSRASTATFYGANGIIQTAATNVGRSNAFFPNSNGVMVPAGLLLEAAATNDHFFSNTFSNSGTGGSNPKWQDFVNVTLEQQQYSDPAGGNTATRIIPTTTSGEHYVGRYSTYSAGTYVHSLFIKPRGYTRLAINSNGTFYYVNLAANPPSISGSGNTIIVLPNGWFRIAWLFVSAGGGANTIQPRIYVLDNSGSSTFTGDGVSGIDVYGFQRETGTYPTSYIPTTTATVTRAADVSSSATVTRSADVAAITGRNFRSWYNNSEGTFFTNMALGFTQNAGNPFLFGGVNYTLQTDVNAIRTLGNQDILSGIPFSQTTFNRIALGLKPKDYAVSVNRNSLTLSALDYRPSGNEWVINSSLGSKGTLSRLTYWPLRLPNATLQAITRPS